MDKQYCKRTKRTRRRPKSENTHWFTQNDIKRNIKLENTRPWWNTLLLVREIPLHSRHTSRDAYKAYKYLTGWPKERTLIQKDPSKGTAPNYYRPITCLPMMWKILPAQIRVNIYYTLSSCWLFPDEQKRCRKWSRGTAELLYIDQHILNESKTRRKNLAMAWIDYKKGRWYGFTKLDNTLS